MPTDTRLLASLGVGAVAAAGTAVWLWQRKREEDVQWEEVGEVANLMVFPIKSGGGYKVEEVRLNRYGFVDGQVVDRSFVVVMKTSSGWSHITQGNAPPLCTLVPTMKDSLLTLTALSGDSIKIDTAKAIAAQPQKFAIKGSECTGYDCGQEAADWLQQKLYPSAAPDQRPTLKLMFVGEPDDLRRPARIPPYYHFPQFKKEDMQVYHDNCAFHLFTSESFADLNSRLQRPMTLGQMRPNIVVKGSRRAYDEDDWAYVRIGEGVKLRTLKPRDTCARINIRPDTGEKQEEVLNVLKEYRIMPLQAGLKEHWAKKPLFGLHLALDFGSQIRVGDKVWACRKKPHWFL